uniref:2-oxoglutaramate amidase n=1 Tax=Candidatus Berkiella cookevillensis TaxID=437022 RepID=A0A0Q9YD59_9GAMM
MIHVATSQYAIELLPDWQSFADKMNVLVGQAKAQGIHFLVLPEYGGIEIYPQYEATDQALFNGLQPLLPQYIDFFQSLAKKHQIYIQPGSIIVKSAEEQFMNRAYLFGPQGDIGFQDKMQIIADEKEHDLLACGTMQTLFETSFGLIGIAICYDSEFPELIRNFTRQGAKLIVVPSFTPSQESFLRVYYSCQARAIENQCYVLTSSAVGRTKIGDTLYTLEGQANIFTPIDVGFSEGILTQGKKNETALVQATLDFDKLNEVRKYGQVQNFYDYMDMDLSSNSLSKVRLE